MRNKPFLTIILLNTFVASIAQIMGWRFVFGPADASITVLLILPPLSLVAINVLLFIFERAPFATYVKGAYLGYCTSLLPLAIVTFDLTKELPPGEIILFADVLFLGLTMMLQLIVVCSLHLFTFLFYKRFARKNAPL